MGNARFNTLALVACGLVWLLLVLNAGIRARDNPNSGRDPIASDTEIVAFATEALNDLQARSLATRTEYCALLLEDDEGNLAVSKIAEGKEAECDLPWVLPMGTYSVATMHTHGTYSQEYDSEVPSVLDIQSDVDEQIDGFVATPGGRIWFTDWKTETTSMVCGERCIAQDPKYREDAWGQLKQSYTLGEIKERQGR